MKLAATVALSLCALILRASEPVPIVIEHSMPLVRASVNGFEPLVFIVDTAAARVCVDKKFVPSLRLVPRGQAASSGSGGVVQADVYDGAPVRIGPHEFTPDQIRALDFSAFARAFKQQIGGILGRPFFERWAVEIDYPRKGLRLLDPGNYETAGKIVDMKLGIAPTVPGRIRVRGGEPIELSLEVDTGSGNMLVLAAPFVRKHDLLSKARDLKSSTGYGVGGANTSMQGRIDSVEVAGFVVQDPETNFPQGGAGVFNQDYRDGNIGGLFFERFKVTFDFTNLRLILRE